MNEKEQKKPLRYTIIFHQERIQFGLNCNEFCIADSIYHLSNNPNNEIPGWCWASREFLGANIGITRQAVIKIIKKLAKKGLIEIQQNKTKYLRTTNLWYQNVVIRNPKNVESKKSLHTVNNEYVRSKKALLSDSKESLPNNNINKERKNSFSDEKQISSFEEEKYKFKDKNIYEIENLFIEKCNKNLDIVPKINITGRKSIQQALEILGFRYTKDLIEEWFTLAKQDSELVQITRALSFNQINAYRVRNHVTEKDIIKSKAL